MLVSIIEFPSTHIMKDNDVLVSAYTHAHTRTQTQTQTHTPTLTHPTKKQAAEKSNKQLKIFLCLGLKHLSECCVIVDLSQGSGLSTCFSYLYMYGYGMSLCMHHIGCFTYIMQMRNSLLITIDMLISQYSQHKSMTHNDPKLLIILN